MTTPDRPDTHPETVVALPRDDASADELVADIEATRAQLGDTVEALAHKLDVKAQAQHGLDEAKHRATSQAQDLRARAVEAFGRARDAATDDRGRLTARARTYATAGAGAVGVLVVVRVVVRYRRRR